MLRAKWRWGIALSVMAGGVGLGLAIDPGTRAPSATPRSPSVLGSGPQGFSEGLPASEPDMAPAESAVADFRRRTLNPEPQRLPSSLIAISGARVGRIEPDALVVVEPGTRKPNLVFALPGAFAVAATPTALFAVGKDRLLLLGPGEKKPISMPRPSLFPDSVLMPDLNDSTRIWVRHVRSNSLFGYVLDTTEAALLVPVESMTLAGAADGAFLALADGSFVRYTGEGWERLFVQGKRFELSWPKHDVAPFRALRAHRLDQFYVLFADGKLERYQIGTPMLKLWSTDLGSLPVDVATSGDSLVLLRSDRSKPDALNWKLEVIHPKRPAASLPLGASDADSFRGDWHAQLLRQYGLAASSRWIVLGGAGQLRVWDVKTLEPVSAPD